MITSSDEDVPALDDVFGLWNQQTMVSIKNIYITSKKHSHILDTFTIINTSHV